MMKQYYKNLHKKILRHAFSEAPNECCGIIIDDDYVECKNCASDKEYDFKIEKHIVSTMYRSGKMQAIIHSHVDRPHLSKLDMINQRNMGVPWGVAFVNSDGSNNGIHFWGDNVESQIFLTRPFIYGIYDCYSLCSDYYKDFLKDRLPFVARGLQEWELIAEEEIENALNDGFSEVKDRKNLMPGDIFTFKIRSGKTNHFAVYTGDSMMLHHLYGRLSSHVSIYPWLNAAEKVLRKNA